MSNTINKDFGSGGAPLNPHGGSAVQPSLRDVLQGIADDHAILGLICTTPTTPSTQAPGTGATDWNIDITPGEVTLARTLLAANVGDYAQFDAQTDVNIHTGTMLVAASQSAYARLVARNVTGTITLVAVAGTAAATGSETVPSDATVQAAVGATAPWLDVCLCHLTRDAGVGLTQTQQNSYRLKTIKGTTD